MINNIRPVNHNVMSPELYVPMILYGFKENDFFLIGPSAALPVARVTLKNWKNVTIYAPFNWLIFDRLQRSW